MKNSQICNMMQEKTPMLPAGKFVKENSKEFVLVNTSVLGPLVSTWFLSVLCLLLISGLFLTLPFKVSVPYDSVLSHLLTFFSLENSSTSTTLTSITTSMQMTEYFHFLESFLQGAILYVPLRDGQQHCPSSNHHNPPSRLLQWDFHGGTVVKNPPANSGDTGLSPGPGRSHMPQSN